MEWMGSGRVREGWMMKWSGSGRGVDEHERRIYGSERNCTGVNGEWKSGMQSGRVKWEVGEWIGNGSEIKEGV